MTMSRLDIHGILLGIIVLTLAFIIATLFIFPKSRQEAIKDVYESYVSIMSKAKESDSLYASGGGVILDKDKGIILTLAHIVNPQDSGIPMGAASEATPEISAIIGGEKLPARILYREKPDIVILKANIPPEIRYRVKNASFANSEILDWDDVCAWGEPLDTPSVSCGIISQKRYRVPEIPQLEELKGVWLIQTDSAINTGNSGGPLFLVRGKYAGKIIGIVNMRATFEGIAFAIRSDTLRGVFGRTICKKELSRFHALCR